MIAVVEAVHWKFCGIEGKSTALRILHYSETSRNKSILPSLSIIVTSADAVDMLASEDSRSIRNSSLLSVMESSKIGIVIADRILPAGNTSDPDPTLTSTPSTYTSIGNNLKYNDMFQDRIGNG